MDNYLLMGHLLQCKVIPKDKIHPELWVGANRKWKNVPRHRIERANQNKVSLPQLSSVDGKIN
jgi:nucleolar protein 15